MDITARWYGFTALGSPGSERLARLDVPVAEGRVWQFLEVDRRGQIREVFSSWVE